jgi:RNA recognition motif-containing protein
MRPAPFKANIIIWNIPEDFTDGQLASLFDDYGLVVGAKIDRWPNEPGRTARGLVDLAPAKAVDTAIEALDGSRIEQHKLKVRRVPDPPPRPKNNKPRPAPGDASRPSRLSAPRPGAARPSAPLPNLDVEPSENAPRAPRKPIVEYRTSRSRRLVTTGPGAEPK